MNFGRDYAGARDVFVYSYYIQPVWGPGAATKTTAHSFDVHQPGRVHLSRVPKDSILNRQSYEFFAGIGPDGRPVWTTDLKRKQPVFADANGVGWNVSVSYNPALRRYILGTEHAETHAGKMGLFDAPEPWGPWTTVAYDDAWGAGHIEVTTFYWNFSQKWLRGFLRPWPGLAGCIENCHGAGGNFLVYDNQTDLPRMALGGVSPDD